MSQSRNKSSQNSRHPARAKESASTPNPGDQAAPGTPGTGEDVCPHCRGSGRIGNEQCSQCGGSGRVIKGIGGG